MRHRQFMSQVARYGGFTHDLEAEFAVRVVFTVLRESLPDADAHALAHELPNGLSDVLRSNSYKGPRTLFELRDRVAVLEGVRPGFAVEHLQAVLRAIRDIVPPEALLHLRRNLPLELATELDESPIMPPPPRSWRSAQSGPRDSHVMPISSGRPWSSHPISESRLVPGQANSVVVSDDPHADTKLSSSRGLTQERTGRALASGKPSAR
ncbi:MAG: DUF2267 domain-containing protein [Polyangiaceae bacterium]|nr:DUF2267 domain-containing protein [Polyangiaceae bacterium]